MSYYHHHDHLWGGPLVIVVKSRLVIAIVACTAEICRVTCSIFTTTIVILSIFFCDCFSLLGLFLAVQTRVWQLNRWPCQLWQHSQFLRCFVVYVVLLLFFVVYVFGCPGSSMPSLVVTYSLTATLEFRHKEWLLRLGWHPSDIWSEWCLDEKTIRQKDKKTRRQKPNREFDIVMSGQFRTLAMFS